MGKSKVRRAEFLAAHPLCCFCGGAVPATTEDHIPARSLFLRRWWPERYVFPACEDCNSGSAADEMVMAFLVRVRVRDVSDEERKERRRAIQGLRNNLPAYISNIQKLSRNETRRRAKAIGGLEKFGLDPGSVSMVQLPPECVHAAARYGEKLGKALHYLHTGEALPAAGESCAHVMTNAVAPSVEIPNELMGPLALAPNARLQRGKVDLSDQFSYKYIVLEGGAACCFLITFGDSMSILATTFRDPEPCDLDELAGT